jgi:hypothetical protein
MISYLCVCFLQSICDGLLSFHSSMNLEYGAEVMNCMFLFHGSDTDIML